mmetsp:Transcript_15923/g.28658  ORF Transcript_15923/g.28658 Transcript_15923/m.28658 type:complete len:1321 (-) Transcript_15923:113-4075(-)|eukprot:CAMPEP_0196138168 /NCGR_PEP_ID=MMETSP0910-20130528/5902_1 /TAXON_ID=49265 /ORGANISM="Thalassiosira rotula, Strain GSO102" /LENGTH=1320 /DNA_ID=CAMNT_0041398733 /DNA_START=112 /DNA_END=4074 /DNA_ORIENTATION=+
MDGIDIEEGGGLVHSASTNSLRRRAGGMVNSISTESFGAFLDVLNGPTQPPPSKTDASPLLTSGADKKSDRPSLSPPAAVSITNQRDAFAGQKQNDVDFSSFNSSRVGGLPDGVITDNTEEKRSRGMSMDSKEGEDEGHGHHHGPTAISLIASSIVCFIIYFVFCIVFSSVVWDPLNVALDETINPPFGIPQGVGINLLGIAVGSAFFSLRSGCKAVVGGPDLLPVVFFAEAGACVFTYLQTQHENDMAALCGDYDAHLRFLGGDASGGYDTSDPCGAYHRMLGGGGNVLSPSLMAKIAPTTLAAMMIGNAFTAAVFYTLGKMKNTASVIGFIPASVVAGFLTCIGYKVIKLAVLITTGYAFKEKYIRNIGLDLPHNNDPWVPLLIALIYGVLLYGIKRTHIVAAEKLILGFIFVPIILFFVITRITGVSMDALREQDWFLTQARDGQGCTDACAFTTTNFWQTLQVAYSSQGLVEWRAIPTCIPIFIMGATMTSLDSMLKLTSSEKALSIDLDYNHEMQLGGKATLMSSILCGSPAYGQTKFNVINFSIARTAESPLPTMYLGGICFAVFLSGLAGPIINIMPRFLLGGLCVFAGVGFLYENLYEGRKNMNRVSFAIVWIIFLVNFIWEFFILQNLPSNIQPMVPGLLVVFILGIVLSTFEFMFAFMHKATPPIIRGGDECCSSAVRSEKHDTQLAVMSPWFQVFSVESFVFFGTANNLYQQLKAHLADQITTKPKAERTKYLIFDLAEVTGIDSSAKDVFFKVHRLLKAEGINLVWAMKHPKIIKKFGGWGLFSGTTHCNTLDLALRHVEDVLLRRASLLSDKWLVNPEVRKIFERQVLANVFNISVRSDEKTFSSARLQPWCERMEISAGEELCGDDDDSLYMLYAGEVQIQGRDGHDYSVFTGSFFNLDKLLISIGALSGVPSTLGAHATMDSTVLVVNRKKFVQMQKEDGALTQKLLMTLIVQNESHRPGRVRPIARARMALMEEIDESVHNLNNPDRFSNMSMNLLKGNDYQIQLTEAQEESFKNIFDIIDDDDEKEIPMDNFAKYVIREAKSLGSQIHHKQFMEMIDHSGIDEDGDGVLSIDEFLHFLQGLFLSDIPSKEVPTLRVAYDEAVAEAPDEPMDEARVQVLFAKLGFDVKGAGWQDVMGVIDADGDGDVDFQEFLTGIGMMKKMCILSTKLDDAFRDYKEQSLAKRRSTFALSNAQPEEIKRSKTPGMFTTSFATAVSSKSQRRLFVPQDNLDDSTQSENNMELDAMDLENFLNVSHDMAEEMVFLADQDEVEAHENEDADGSDASIVADRTIDRDEFQQLIRSWS